MRLVPTFLAAACAVGLAPTSALAERAWDLQASEAGGYCIAHALAGPDRQFQVLAADGELGLAISATDGGKLPQGSHGKVEIDGYAFDFKPNYGGDDFVSSDEPLDRQALAALRRATWIKVSVDSAKLLHVALEDTGFADVLDGAVACSRGETGWWGKGAKRP